MDNVFNCEIWQAECNLRGMKNLKWEFAKLEKRLEDQIQKIEENRKSKKVLFYVPVRYGNEVEKVPIHCYEDLEELWQYDYIANRRTFEKYESKLDRLLQTEQKDEKVRELKYTLDALKKVRRELEVDIYDEGEKIKIMKAGA